MSLEKATVKIPKEFAIDFGDSWGIEVLIDALGVCCLGAKDGVEIRLVPCPPRRRD